MGATGNGDDYDPDDYPADLRTVEVNGVTVTVLDAETFRDFPIPDKGTDFTINGDSQGVIQEIFTAPSGDCVIISK